MKSILLQSGNGALDFVPDFDVGAGDVVVLNGFVGVSTRPIAVGALGALVVDGVAKIQKKNESFALFQEVYWDAAGNPYNRTAGTGALTAGSSYVFAGIVLSPAAATDETATVLLMKSGKTRGVGRLVSNDSTAAAHNTALIQAALDAAAGGGEVVIPPALGVVYITRCADARGTLTQNGVDTVPVGTGKVGLYSSLIIGSYTTLHGGDGTTLTLAAGANCLMIRNADTVNGNPGITIIGSFDGNRTNQTVNANWNGHGSTFIKCDHLTVRDGTWNNVGKYAIYPAGCNYLTCENLGGDTYSALIQANGPMAHAAFLNIRATAREGVVNLLSDEVGWYPSPTAGPITDVVMRDLTNISGASPVQVICTDGTAFASSGWYARGITIDGVYGDVTAGPAVNMGDDPTVPTYHGGIYEDISVSHVKAKVAGGMALVSCSGQNFRSIKAHDLETLPGSDQCLLVKVWSNATTMKSVMVSDARLVMDNGTALNYQSAVLIDGVVKNLNVSNVEYLNKGEAGKSVVEINGTVTSTNLTNINSSCNSVLTVHGVATYANVNNIVERGGNAVVDVADDAGRIDALTLNNSNSFGSTWPAAILLVRAGGGVHWAGGSNIAYTGGVRAFQVNADAAFGLQAAFSNVLVKDSAYCLGLATTAGTPSASNVLISNYLGDNTANFAQNFTGNNTATVVNATTVNGATMTNVLSAGSLTLTLK